MQAPSRAFLFLELMSGRFKLELLAPLSPPSEELTQLETGLQRSDSNFQAMIANLET